MACLMLCLSNLATAQDAPAITARSPPTPATLEKRQSSIFLLSGSAMPSATDSAPGGIKSGGSKSDSGSLVNYYFGFLALIICAVGLCIFIVLRRRHRLMRYRAGLQPASQPHLGGGRPDGGWANWNPERRQNWQGRWRNSADASREEGLNEYGEAPPVYMPKTSLEERERAANGSGPAVPLQTLSRDDAGLKPPDYSEVHTTETTAEPRHSTASASSSRVPEPRAGP
jgi:hypothetical protein